MPMRYIHVGECDLISEYRYGTLCVECHCDDSMVWAPYQICKAIWAGWRGCRYPVCVGGGGARVSVCGGGGVHE